MLLKQPVNINVDPTRSSKEVQISLLCLKKKKEKIKSVVPKGGRRGGTPTGVTEI